MKLRTSEEFIEAMWTALIQSPDFKPMIEAWDKVIEADSPQDHIQQLAEGMSGELTRLNVALEARAQLVKHDPALLRDHIDSYIDLDQEQQIVCHSSAFSALQLDIDALQDQLQKIDFTQPGMQLVWGSTQGGSERLLLALTPLDASTPLPQTYLIKSLETDWPSEYDKILSRMFALSPAEIEVLKDLYLGYESNAIADRRDRCVHTVRTRIKSLMEKMGVNNQRRLVRLLSTLFQLDVSEGEVSNEVEPYSRKTLNVSAEHLLEYCDYGDPSGKVIFLITPTISPVPSSYIAQLARDMGVRIIAPFRPGSGLSSPREFSEGPKQIAADYEQLISYLSIGQTQVVGCDSGGLYAAALATRLGSGRCSGLVQIGTGYPHTSIASIMKMSPNSRRTFLVARLSHSILYAPHRIAANDFLLSEEGEKRLVYYFFEGHSHDLQRVKSDPFFYKAVKNIIAYSFQNVDRLVNDVTYWAKDWSQLAHDLPADLPKLSVIGCENKNFGAADLERWCDDNNWEFLAIPDEGQLVFFSKPRELLKAIIKQASK